MPRCPKCGSSVSSEVLLKVNDCVVCPDCRRPKKVEDKMTEDKKQLVSITLNEVPTKDGAIDHEVEVEGGYGGLEVRFKTTFDRIRAFFTQQREKGQKASLRSVK